MSGFKPRTMTVTLYQGDWQDRIDAARVAAERARARSSAPASLGELPEFERLAQEHDDLVAEAVEEGRVLVTLQALARRKWSELVEKHPPRTDESVPEAVRKSDAELGVNDQGLGDELVPLSIVSIEPDMTTEELLDGVSSAQFDLLYGAAFSLNRGTGTDPKGAPSLMRSLSSSETGN